MPPTPADRPSAPTPPASLSPAVRNIATVGMIAGWTAFLILLALHKPYTELNSVEIAAGTLTIIATLCFLTDRRIAIERRLTAAQQLPPLPTVADHERYRESIDNRPTIGIVRMVPMAPMPMPRLVVNGEARPSTALPDASEPGAAQTAPLPEGIAAQIFDFARRIGRREGTATDPTA